LVSLFVLFYIILSGWLNKNDETAGHVLYMGDKKHITLMEGIN
jgi:hypothetical protein